jgi:hypothetical protein
MLSLTLACMYLWYARNKTNLMQYVSSVYYVAIPLHVSGLLAAHHQEVAMYMYM